MLDMKQLSVLTDDEKERYVKAETLFESEHWHVIKTMAEEQSEQALVRGANAQTWDDNRVALGQRLVWEYIATLNETYENEFSQQADARLLAKQSQNEVDYE